MAIYKALRVSVRLKNVAMANFSKIKARLAVLK
jgi:hypothetical protein